jgi:cell division protein FtsQ
MEVRKRGRESNLFHHMVRGCKWVAWSMLLITLIWTINQLQLSRLFPIKTVRVYGLHHTDQRDVRERLTPLVNHGFFAVNVKHIRDRLRHLPWMADIFVRRHWPDQVEVIVVEKEAVARWNKQSLLSTKGELFMPSQDADPQQLPELTGPTGKQFIMLDYFNRMNRLLLPLHMKIAYLELTPSLSWKLMLDNGIILQMGYDNILTRLQHFVKVYPKIVGSRANAVDYIDLRYSNGLAVRWKNNA